MNRMTDQRIMWSNISQKIQTENPSKRL